MSENPFYPTRFEREQRPLIWVSPLAETLMREQGAFFIAGARGSGKTSILKSLDMEERLINETLASQVSSTQMEFFGIYFRATDLFTQSIDGFDWQRLAPNSPDSNLLEISYISALVELTAVRILIDNLTLLRRARRIKYTSAELNSVITQLRLKYPVIFSLNPASNTDPLTQISDTINDAIQELNAAVVRGDKEAFMFCTRLGQPGALLKTAARPLLSLTGPPHFRRGSVRLKICIDECDYLTPKQQRALNSLVRVSKSPLEWVIAYVDTEYDSVSTTFPRQNLTDADRKVVALDDTNKQNSAEFRLRCQAIISYRLFYSLSAERQRLLRDVQPATEIKALFKLAERMPDPGINRLLHHTLTPRAQVSQRVQRFVVDAQIFKDRAIRLGDEFPPYGPDTAARLLSPGPLPYYQMYLFDKLGLRLENYVKQNSDSSVLRRKEVAAMLMLLDDLQIKEIPYAGASWLLTMADGCIRDFLEIMAAIYDQWRATKKHADAWFFLQPTETFPIELQRKGALQSSQAKFRGIDEARLLRDDLTDPNTTQSFSRIVRALGKLTRALQVSSDGKSSLRTAERGIFVIDRDALAGLERSYRIAAGSCLQVLKRLESENLLVGAPERLAARQIQADYPVYRFRLHKRFAPMFGFSHRGALVEVKLPETVLFDLTFANEQFIEAAWLDNALDKIAITTGQPDFFRSDLE